MTVIELAGLCHDVGHGPFSHVFEAEFLAALGIDWCVRAHAQGVGRLPWGWAPGGGGVGG